MRESEVSTVLVISLEACFITDKIFGAAPAVLCSKRSWREGYTPRLYGSFVTLQARWSTREVTVS